MIKIIKRINLLLVSPLVCGAIVFSSVVSAKELPAGGQIVPYSPALTQLKKKNDFSDIQKVTLSNDKYLDVLDINVHKPSPKIWGIQVPFKFENAKVEVGDNILFKIVARSVSSNIADGNVGQMDLFFKYTRRGKPVVIKRLMLSQEWQTFYIPQNVYRGPSTTDMQLALLLGGLPEQHIQIAELELVNYKDKVDAASLPMTKVKYFGSEADAPWRDEAELQISKHRKADFMVKLTDQNNQPIIDAVIDVELSKHDYNFGCGLNAAQLFSVNKQVSAEEQSLRLAQTEKMCNMVTINNSLKWRHYNEDRVTKAMAWLLERDIKVRGHALIWGRFRSAHKDVEKKEDYYREHPEEFQQELIKHIKEFAAFYPEQITEWDVINEPAPEKHFVDILGKEATLDWFKAAREANPEASLCANDYAIISRYDTWHQDAYYDWVKYFNDNKAIDRVCVQGHFQGPMPISEIKQRLDRFAEFGLPIVLTEFDFFEIDEELKAQFTKDLITMFFAHPSTDGFIHWNLSDLYGDNGELNLSGQVYDKLIHQTWHTKASLKTNNKGQLSFNGFKGKYNLKIKMANGKTINQLVELTDSDLVNVKLN
ncbi:endo-1,4-beta-xylanase [Thalassotalea crassostreae]|uniref:endo-1,4-beta-xylanase n=1 Tax=Thalassotalea crassostreae TaxID=1763536 RepID=UPI000837D349|nr:endo-1,4-beta-xylanase [Thalassotalea crassostreae]